MFDGIPPVTVAMTNSLFSRDVVVIYDVPRFRRRHYRRMNNDTTCSNLCHTILSLQINRLLTASAIVVLPSN